jgi:hypothetical protein
LTRTDASSPDGSALRRDPQNEVAHALVRPPDAAERERLGDRVERGWLMAIRIMRQRLRVPTPG